MRALAALVVVLPALAGCVAPEPGSLATAEGAAAGMPAPFSWTSVFPGEYSTERPRVAERGAYGVLRQEQNLVPSDIDGAKIQIFVVRPDVPGGVKVPVIADAGPYFPAMTRGRSIPEDHVMIENFVRHGYAYAWISVRGTGDSGGCMDLMGPKERDDVDQAVTWLGTQEWSNGNVGLFGGSYDGSTQWEAASTGNRHLKTIVPLAAIPDLFEHQVWNGTISAWTPAVFSSIYWFNYGPLLYNPVTGRSGEHAASQVPCESSAKGTAVTIHTTATGARDPTGYWGERDWKDDVLANYEGSILLIHGFYDVTVEPHNAYPFVSALEEKGLVVKHVLGPWGHEAPWRADWPEMLLRWYDRFLKGNATVDLGPKVVVQDNALAWRIETSWPPADAVRVPFYLSEGGLVRDPPTTGGTALVGAMAPVKDPQELDRHNGPMKVYEFSLLDACAACPSFATEPLDEDLRFAGAPRLPLTVTATGPGGHVTAIVYALHEDGAKERIAFGAMDLRYADGSETPKQVTPGSTFALAMELEPVDAVVPAGSKLALQIHQGGYGVRIPSATTFPVRVHFDGTSALELPVIVRGPEAFHEAPPRIGPETPPR